MSLPNKVILVNREEWEKEKQEELDRKQKLGRRRRFLEERIEVGSEGKPHRLHELIS